MAEAREAAVLLFMSVESQDVGLAEALLDLSPEVLDVRCVRIPPPVGKDSSRAATSTAH